MMTPSDPGAAAATRQVVEWLAELGPRWGLPAAACRIHGWLFLTGRHAGLPEIAEAAEMAAEDAESAMAWLRDHDLAERDGEGRWHTSDDPWELVVKALDRRRERELGPALAVLRASRAQAAADPGVAARIQGLLDLLADIAAIDAQARRFSPRTLRRLIGVGGRAARLVGGALGSRGISRR